MEDLNVNPAIWVMFMNTTLQAAVHLGQDYDQNLRFVKKDFLDFFEEVIQRNQKLIKNQTEIIGIWMIDYEEYTWSATSLLCDRIFKISNAKTNVFADSVLCLGGVKENPNDAWKEEIKWYFESNHLKELNRIDGGPMEFEWRIFPGFTTCCLLEQIQEFMKERRCDPEQSEGRIIFMSMFNDFVWRAKENAEKCKGNSREVANYALSQISARSLVILGTWIRKRNGTELLTSLMYGTKLLKPLIR